MLKPVFTITAYAGPNHPSIVPGEVVIVGEWPDMPDRDAEIDRFKKQMARGEISYIDVTDHKAGRTDRVFRKGSYHVRTA